jgi:cellulose synthase/poly-beta-1,6-N-acetylglucosamine synthase-like glycosyltransferase
MWLSLSIVHVIKKEEGVSDDVEFNPHPPLVSILLPCRNEEGVIGTVIQQALNQTYKDIEILVVAHNCTDKTAEVARKFTDPRVKVFELKTKESGKGLGLIYGSEQAKGEFIIYFDSDSLISKDYVEKIVKVMVSKGYDVIQGKIIGANPDYNRLCFLQHMENQIFLSMFWGGKHKLGLPSGLGGTGVSIRKSALDDIGGFKNVLIEDFDLCVRAQLAGKKVGYCRDAVVYDEKVPKYSMLVKQRSRWLAGHLQLIGILIKEKTFGKLFVENPVDFFQLLSPVYTMCLWLGVIVGVITTLQNQIHLFYDGWISFFYVPLLMFLVQTLALQLLFVLVIRKEARTKAEFVKSVLNLPAFYIYSMQWFWVIIRTIVYRKKMSWAYTKTEHGFRG